MNLFIWFFWMVGLIYGAYTAHTAGEAIMDKRYDVACVRAFFALNMLGMSAIIWYKIFSH